VGETAAGLTDLLLGSVLVGCALRLRSVPGLHRYWPLTFWAAGAGAYAGVTHHLLFQDSRRSADLSWVAVGLLIALAMSYLLAASAAELVSERVGRLFLRIRIAGLVTYVLVISIIGVGRTLPLVLSESLTMASVVGLWLYGLYVDHPRAARMLVAIGGCALSAAALAIPTGVRDAIGIDGRSLQHLAQIPGVLLLLYAVSLPLPAPTDPARAAGEPPSTEPAGTGAPQADRPGG
jgi:hypothetical protein